MTLQLFQVLFTKQENNAIPLTRDFMYPAISRRSVRNAEVIVVGGGPAGSAAAQRLQSAGADVLVLDKETLSAAQTVRGLDHAAGGRAIWSSRSAPTRTAS